MLLRSGGAHCSAPCPIRSSNATMSRAFALLILLSLCYRMTVQTIISDICNSKSGKRMMYDNHCFICATKIPPMSFSDAYTYCNITSGGPPVCGRLAWLWNTTVWNAVSTSVQLQSAKFWIGLGTDNPDTNDWHWMTSPTATGPQCAFPTGVTVTVDTAGAQCMTAQEDINTWDDDDCDKTYPFLCEYYECGTTTTTTTTTTTMSSTTTGTSTSTGTTGTTTTTTTTNVPTTTSTSTTASSSLITTGQITQITTDSTAIILTSSVNPSTATTPEDTTTLLTTTAPLSTISSSTPTATTTIEPSTTPDTSTSAVSLNPTITTLPPTTPEPTTALWTTTGPAATTASNSAFMTTTAPSSTAATSSRTSTTTVQATTTAQSTVLSPTTGASTTAVGTSTPTTAVPVPATSTAPSTISWTTEVPLTTATATATAKPVSTSSSITTVLHNPSSIAQSTMSSATPSTTAASTAVVSAQTTALSTQSFTDSTTVPVSTSTEQSQSDQSTTTAGKIGTGGYNITTTAFESTSATPIITSPMPMLSSTEAPMTSEDTSTILSTSQDVTTGLPTDDVSTSTTTIATSPMTTTASSNTPDTTNSNTITSTPPSQTITTPIQTTPMASTVPTSTLKTTAASYPTHPLTTITLPTTSSVQVTSALATAPITLTQTESAITLVPSSQTTTVPSIETVMISSTEITAVVNIQTTAAPTTETTVRSTRLTDNTITMTSMIPSLDTTVSAISSTALFSGTTTFGSSLHTTTAPESVPGSSWYITDSTISFAPHDSPTLTPDQSTPSALATHPTVNIDTALSTSTGAIPTDANTDKTEEITRETSDQPLNPTSTILSTTAPMTSPVNTTNPEPGSSSTTSATPTPPITVHSTQSTIQEGEPGRSGTGSTSNTGRFSLSLKPTNSFWRPNLNRLFSNHYRCMKTKELCKPLPPTSPFPMHYNSPNSTSSLPETATRKTSQSSLLIASWVWTTEQTALSKVTTETNRTPSSTASSIAAAAKTMPTFIPNLASNMTTMPHLGTTQAHPLFNPATATTSPLLSGNTSSGIPHTTEYTIHDAGAGYETSPFISLSTNAEKLSHKSTLTNAKIEILPWSPAAIASKPALSTDSLMTLASSDILTSPPGKPFPITTPPTEGRETFHSNPQSPYTRSAASLTNGNIMLTTERRHTDMMATTTFFSPDRGSPEYFSKHAETILSASHSSGWTSNPDKKLAEAEESSPQLLINPTAGNRSSAVPGTASPMRTQEATARMQTVAMMAASTSLFTLQSTDPERIANSQSAINSKSSSGSNPMLEKSATVGHTIPHPLPEASSVLPLENMKTPITTDYDQPAAEHKISVSASPVPDEGEFASSKATDPFYPTEEYVTTKREASGPSTWPVQPSTTGRFDLPVTRPQLTNGVVVVTSAAKTADHNQTLERSTFTSILTPVDTSSALLESLEQRGTSAAETITYVAVSEAITTAISETQDLSSQSEWLSNEDSSQTSSITAPVSSVKEQYSSAITPIVPSSEAPQPQTWTGSSPLSPSYSSQQDTRSTSSDARQVSTLEQTAITSQAATAASSNSNATAAATATASSSDIMKTVSSSETPQPQTWAGSSPLRSSYSPPEDTRSASAEAAQLSTVGLITMTSKAVTGASSLPFQSSLSSSDIEMTPTSANLDGPTESSQTESIEKNASPDAVEAPEPPFTQPATSALKNETHETASTPSAMISEPAGTAGPDSPPQAASTPQEGFVSTGPSAALETQSPDENGNNPTNTEPNPLSTSNQPSDATREKDPDPAMTSTANGTDVSTTPKGEQLQLPMTDTERIIANVMRILGCVYVVGVVSAIMVLFQFLLRNFTFERKIHLCQELALLLAHIDLMLFATRVGTSTEVCKFSAVISQYFFTTLFAFQTVEALQIQAITTNAAYSNGIFICSPAFVFGLGFGLPALITGCCLTALHGPSQYIGSFTCWLNMDTAAAKAVLIPMFGFMALAAILLEAGALQRTARFPLTSQRQWNTALINHGGLTVLIVTNAAAMMLGILTMHFQKLAWFTLTLAMNVTNACCIFFFHALGDYQCRALLQRAFRCLSKQGKNIVRR